MLVYILDGGIPTCDAPLYFIMSNDQDINGKSYHSSLLVACLYFLVEICMRVQETCHHFKNRKKRDVICYNVTPAIVIDT